MWNLLLGFGIGVLLTILFDFIDEAIFWGVFEKRKPYEAEGKLKQHHHDDFQ